MQDGNDRPLAIVTGASGGIGAPLARGLARRGYRLVLMGRDTATLAALVDELGPGRATSLAVDLLDGEAAERAVAALLAEAGPAEVLVNNAGAGMYRPFLELGEAEHRWLVELNYLAPAKLTRQALPGMLEAGRGWVINISSMAGRIGPWGHAGYAGAKAALLSLTQTLAAEYGGSGVHFCAVCPGIVDTAFFHRPDIAPLWRRVRRRALTPEHVARRIESLLDRPRTEMCIPGHHRLLDWLHAAAPGFAVRLVAGRSRPGVDGRG